MQPSTDVPGGGHLPRQRWAQSAGERTAGRWAHGGLEMSTKGPTAHLEPRCGKKAGRASQGWICFLKRWGRNLRISMT